MPLLYIRPLYTVTKFAVSIVPHGKKKRSYVLSNVPLPGKCPGNELVEYNGNFYLIGLFYGLVALEICDTALNVFWYKMLNLIWRILMNLIFSTVVAFSGTR